MAADPTPGITGISGAVIVAGRISIFTAPFVSRVLALFPPFVTGTIIAVLLNLFFNGIASQDEAEAAAKANTHGSE